MTGGHSREHYYLSCLRHSPFTSPVLYLTLHLFLPSWFLPYFTSQLPSPSSHSHKRVLSPGPCPFILFKQSLKRSLVNPRLSPSSSLFTDNNYFEVLVNLGLSWRSLEESVVYPRYISYTPITDSWWPRCKMNLPKSDKIFSYSLQLNPSVDFRNSRIIIFRFLVTVARTVTDMSDGLCLPCVQLRQ